MRKPDWKMVIVGLAAMTALAGPAFGADLAKFKDWDRSPEYVYLATDAEKKEWKKVNADEGAEKFVALFWAKRDPDIKTPVNELKQRFDALVEQADKIFKTGTKRGALTEMGRALILIGPPRPPIGHREDRAGGAPGLAGARDNQSMIDSGAPGSVITTWEFKYEEEQLPKWAGMKALTLRFQAEQARSTDLSLDSSMLKKLSAKALQAALTYPDLKELPIYKTREQVEAEMKAAAEAAAEKERGPELTPAVRTALEAALAKDPAGALAPLGLAYRDGATRLMIQIHAPASAVTTPESVKLAILVKAKDGKDAARREEPARLMKDKDDTFADRIIPVVPGDFQVAAALLDTSGNVISIGHRPASVASLPAEFGASPLFLAYSDLDIPSLKPDDPFVFAMRKFVARGENRFDSKKDGLSYEVRIYNPGFDPVTRKTALKRTIRIKPKGGGSGQEVPLPSEEATVIPEAKDGFTGNVVDLAGAIVDSKLGEYFRSGDFEFRVRVTDDILKKSVEVSAPFTVFGPPPAEKAPPKKK